MKNIIKTALISCLFLAAAPALAAPKADGWVPVSDAKKVAWTGTSSSSILTKGAPAREETVVEEEPVRTAVNAPKEERRDETVFVVERKLKELLEVAGTRERLEVKVSRGVRGVVRDARLPANVEDMLAELSRSYDIVWYRKNRTINVSSSAESQSRLIFLGDASFDRFKSSMRDAGLADAPFTVEYLPEARSVSLSGPVSFLANAELIADALAKSGSNRSIVVIRSGQMNAEDRTEQAASK